MIVVATYCKASHREIFEIKDAIIFIYTHIEKIRAENKNLAT